MNTGEQGSPKVSYGKTLADLEVLRKQQNHGTVEMVPARNGIPMTGLPQHKMVEELASGYMVPKAEESHVYHIILDNPLYDENGGHRIDRGPSVQKFNKAAYDLAQKNGGFMAKKFYILHDPERAEESVEGLSPKQEESSNIISTEAEVKAEQLATENQILESQNKDKDKEIEELKQRLLESNELSQDSEAPELKDDEDDLDVLIDELEEGKETKND